MCLVLVRVVALGNKKSPVLAAPGFFWGSAMLRRIAPKFRPARRTLAVDADLERRHGCGCACASGVQPQLLESANVGCGRH
jgi:hypothetical protein